MRLLSLTNGGAVVVDDSDYAYLCLHRWQKSPQGYAYRCEKGKTLLMHRVVTGAKRGDTVDHINRDTLDNRRCNLRIVGKSLNAINSKPNRANTSGFRNVTFRKDTGKWQAGMTRNRRYVNLGSFATPELASAAVQNFIATGGAE